MPFYTGNIHCHSTNSDGDSPPQVVAQAYQDAGFDFLSFTDHNYITQPQECAVTNPHFLVIPGSEYSAGLNEPRYRSIHVNGIGIKEAFTLLDDYTDVSEGLQHAVNQTKQQGAFSVLNHPNWKWSFGAKEILATDADAFEVWNGGWTCNSAGDAQNPSTDVIWDEVLSNGKCIWGVGSDDCHRFQPETFPDPYIDKMATGWIEVQADSLTQEAILAAMKRGDFIATTRVKLDSLVRNSKEIRFTIKEWDEVTFETHIIGHGGKILDKQFGRDVSYTIKGDEQYVRAKIYSATGHHAWIQPVFI